MQDDGNLVLFDANYTAFRYTGSQSAGAYLIIQDDGNLAVYNNGVIIFGRGWQEHYNSFDDIKRAVGYFNQPFFKVKI